jgi:ABC-type lipoprotein export system ATPase subunit
VGDAAISRSLQHRARRHACGAGWDGAGDGRRGAAAGARRRCCPAASRPARVLHPNGGSIRRFSELSGGQKQRVLIARALAAKPDFLLLDEPTAGIDPAASQAIMDLLRRIHEQQKLTLLMVNHDLAAVRRAVQQVLWLHDGRVLQGPADELLTRDKIEEILKLELL